MKSAGASSETNESFNFQVCWRRAVLERQAILKYSSFMQDIDNVWSLILGVSGWGEWPGCRTDRKILEVARLSEARAGLTNPFERRCTRFGGIDQPWYISIGAVLRSRAASCLASGFSRCWEDNNIDSQSCFEWRTGLTCNASFAQIFAIRLQSALHRPRNSHVPVGACLPQMRPGGQQGHATPPIMRSGLSIAHCFNLKLEEGKQRRISHWMLEVEEG